MSPRRLDFAKHSYTLYYLLSLLYVSLTMSVTKKNGCRILPQLRKELWWSGGRVPDINGDVGIFPEANARVLM